MYPFADTTRCVTVCSKYVKLKMDPSCSVSKGSETKPMLGGTKRKKMSVVGETGEPTLTRSSRYIGTTREKTQ